jgi:hypothetical protein
MYLTVFNVDMQYKICGHPNFSFYARFGKNLYKLCLEFVIL